MYKFSEEIIINANPEEIFSVYLDVLNWKKWDHGIQSSSISGPCIVGAVGKLKPTCGPETEIKIVEIEKNKLFTTQSKLPLCIMTFEHILSLINNSTQVTHRVSFSGPLSFIFSRLIGNQIRKDLPHVLKNLEHLIETKVTL